MVFPEIAFKTVLMWGLIIIFTSAITGFSLSLGKHMLNKMLYSNGRSRRINEYKNAFEELDKKINVNRDVLQKNLIDVAVLKEQYQHISDTLTRIEKKLNGFS